MQNKTGYIQNATDLQSLVGVPHDIIKAKVLRKLDRHCLAYLKQSPIVFLGFRYKEMSEILILDANPGFIEVINNATLRIPHHLEFSIVDAEVFNQPLPISLYCWLPGIEETLRINGVATTLVNDKTTNESDKISFKAIRIAVKGVFLHCAKSIKRSKLWTEKKYQDREIDFKTEEDTFLDDNHRKFIASSPFICLHTLDGVEHTELSPRGDPEGFVYVVDDKFLLIPDRPGNKRVDSMYNLLKDSRLGIIFLVPGTSWVLKINGKASLVSKPEILQPLAIKNKVPKLGILVAVTQCQFYRSSALKWYKIWTQAALADKKQFPPLGQILAEQTAKNKSLLTKIKGRIVSAVIERDYKKNMY
jgi:uncharacterized protein